MPGVAVPDVGLMTGRELSTDLARQMQQAGLMVWTNMPLGSVQNSNPGIVDVLTMSKSYNCQVRIYEVKVTRQDFWGDINRGKYQRYFNKCDQMYFATPPKLVTKEEVPEGCGLITRGDKGWHVIKGARRNHNDITKEFLLALLMRGQSNYGQERRRLEAREYLGLADAALQFGKSFARDIVKSQEYLKKAEELKGKVDAVLGENSDSLGTAIWHLESAINQRLAKYRFAEEISLLTQVMQKFFNGTPKYVVKDLQRIIERIKTMESAT